MPSTTHACGRFWEKPLPSDCFMTKCVFSHMCPSSHVLSPLLGVRAQTLTHTQSVHENTQTRMRLLTNAHSFSVSHTHTHTDEFPGGQAGGLAGTEMDTCWDQSSSVWFTFLSLSLSISRFLLSLIIDAPLPPLPALFTPLCLCKPECFKCILHTNSSEDCSQTYRQLDICDWNLPIFALSPSRVFSVLILHSPPSFCPFFM